MGGQACILYGAAEFARDVDLAGGSKFPSRPPLRSAKMTVPCARST